MLARRLSNNNYTVQKRTALESQPAVFIFTLFAHRGGGLPRYRSSGRPKEDARGASSTPQTAQLQNRYAQGFPEHPVSTVITR